MNYRGDFAGQQGENHEDVEALLRASSSSLAITRHQLTKPARAVAADSLSGLREARIEHVTLDEYRLLMNLLGKDAIALPSPVPPLNEEVRRAKALARQCSSGRECINQKLERLNSMRRHYRGVLDAKACIDTGLGSPRGGGAVHKPTCRRARSVPDGKLQRHRWRLGSLAPAAADLSPHASA
ncbi:hypothetical protein FOZ63_002722 [Perkinsus olseni]|uniref:Uncharacterized protein n=1 Tax=Perkinsus olseni TaxID=32597 RepID=A0A7J6NPR3_PEROL|nr:hypothetical protein FOZ60_006060 [Perkinsus olseni]KAF4713429.1 hypothetical protein FOZ62_031217 [Perkinsus olseni]KAF4738611.1 hypothetical protein FOZ63_002722 [Perkinsus olseni]